MSTSFFHFVTIHAFDRQMGGQKGRAIPCVALLAVVNVSRLIRISEIVDDRDEKW